MSTIRKYVDLNEVDLITAVEKHKILYDRTLKGYKKPVERENAWQSVGKQINFPASECKKRWRSLRDAFLKQHRWMLKGNQSVKKKTWIFFSQMQFLMPYITHAAQSSIKEDYDDNSSNTGFKETKIEIEEINFLSHSHDENIETESEEHLYDTNDLIHFPVNVKTRPNDTDGGSPDHTNAHSPIDSLSTLTPAEGSSSSTTKCLNANDLNVKSAGSTLQFDLLDSNDQFLLSCSPILKRMSKRKNSLVRMKIQRLLYDIEFEDENVSD